ncbi:hypothetical protein BDL97_08G006900 [Sphagnum fallax]|nr:hypothetical protein BDL97_08G006900 [Sphagnum fallax]
MRDDVALSFDGAEPFRGQRPRAPAGQMAGGQGPMGRNGASVLPFMPFDLGAPSSGNVAPPSGRLSYGGGSGNGFGAFEDELPLLEELGINIPQIMRRTITVLNPFRINPDLHEDADLSGPIIFCVLFGVCQLLAGKLHFGVILGWTTLASLFLYMVFNLLAGKNGSLDLYRCVSLVGYCLIPMVLFSALSIFVPGRGLVKLIMAAVTVLWCTRSCTSLMAVLVPHADEHKVLVAYPCGLIYMAFSLLVVF